MNDYTFFGRVLPERADVSISEVRLEGVYEFDASDRTSRIIADSLRISAVASQITVVLSNVVDDLNLSTLKNTVQAAAQMMVDALCYQWCRGYDVEMTACVGPRGSTVFGVEETELRSRRPRATEDDVDRSIRLSVQDPFFRSALANLREAIRMPGDTAFFCQRAVEALAHHFAGNAKVNPEHWKLMSVDLRVDRSVTKLIWEYAKAPRHGQVVSIDGRLRTKILELAWSVVDRYRAFAHNGYKALGSQLPLLTQAEAAGSLSTRSGSP